MTIPFQKICIIYKIYVFVSEIFQHSAVINISRHTRKKNNYEELFVLILYYILAKWLYL